MSAQIQPITAIQQQVVAQLANGLSFSAAAVAAGVHRNTVLNWRRESPDFAEAFEQAAREQAHAFQEEARNAVPQATQIILAIMNDSGSTPALRLRAAGMILKMADLKSVKKPENLHNSAQSPSALSFAPPRRCEKSLKPEIVHNSAQPYRREQPKVGRNEPCPCGSNRKFKLCCLNAIAS